MASTVAVFRSGELTGPHGRERVVDDLQAQRHLHHAEHGAEDRQHDAHDRQDLPRQHHDHQVGQHDRDDDAADHPPSLRGRTQRHQHHQRRDAVGRDDGRESQRHHGHLQVRRRRIAPTGIGLDLELVEQALERHQEQDEPTGQRHHRHWDAVAVQDGVAEERGHQQRRAGEADQPGDVVRQPGIGPS
jgi:hypothetical protein